METDQLIGIHSFAFSLRSCQNLAIFAQQYNAFNVYRRELAPGTVSLTGDRAQGDDSKHWAYSTGLNNLI